MRSFFVAPLGICGVFVEVMIDSFLLRCLGITLLSLKYEYSHLHM